MSQEILATPSRPLNTAVLFLIFNRLDTTKKVFAAIRQAKPPRLYISADGPRSSKEGEAEKVRTVRNYVLSNIDWDCEVKTLFREKNLGCKIGVSEGISWFFENEEEGIILEDDVLPIPSFFPYCEELLEHYRHSENIALISGLNPISDYIQNNDSYFLSYYKFIWGWASWRRVWQQIDIPMKTWPAWRDKGGLKQIFPDDPLTEIYFRNIFDSTYKGIIDTWDYPFTISCWINNMHGIISTNNQIINLGYGDDNATNTQGNAPECLLSSPPIPIIFPLKHPIKLDVSTEIDSYISRNFFGTHKFYSQILRHYIRNSPRLKKIIVKLILKKRLYFESNLNINGRH
jgi:hypothetical protein